jgi:ribosomal protein S15P/S13E
VLTPAEQAEVLRLARGMGVLLERHKKQHRKGEMSDRSLKAAAERAQQRLADYLKEVG